MKRTTRILRRKTILLSLLLTIFTTSLVVLQHSSANTGTLIQPSNTGSVDVAYGKMPLSFERNDGQMPEDVRFVSHGDGYQLFLTNTEAVLALRQSERKSDDTKQSGYRVVRMRLVGANETVESSGEQMQPGTMNYFIGNKPDQWRTNVPLYGKVHYREIYKGINLVYYGNQRQLEYDFEVSPGADPNVIRLQFAGTDQTKIDKKDGSLVLDLGDHEIRFKNPVIYQVQTDGSRKEIKGGYRVRKEFVGFEVGEFDKTRPLVIDPILTYSTYLGGFQSESGAGIAVDPTGAAYVTGQTSSFFFPTTGINFIPSDNSTGHAFITKFDPSGSTLVYSTQIGGSGGDQAFAISIDSTGASYITGRTGSNNFPTRNAIRGNFNLLKSNNSGASWNASNVGLENLAVYDIAVHPTSPNIVFAGTASGNGIYKSTDGGVTWIGLNTGVNFVQDVAIDPLTPNTMYGAARGPFFGVIKSIDGGSTWSQTTLTSAGVALAIDPATPTTVYASTFSGIFKTTNSGVSWQPANAGINAGGLPVLVVDPSNSATLYAGGSTGVWKSVNGAANWTQINNNLSNAAVNALAVDPSDSNTVYVGTFGGLFKSTNGGSSWNPMNAGLTNQVITSLLVDPNSPSTVYAGTQNSRIFKSINGAGNWSILYSGLSGFSGPSIEALTFGAGGSVLAGLEVRTSIDNEAFVTKLNPTGNALVFSTYLGGTGSDEGDGIAVDPAGNVVVVGQTSAVDFPLANPRQSALQGQADAFVTKLSSSGTSFLYSTYLGGQFFDNASAVAVDTSGNAYVTGSSTSPNFPITPGAFQTTQTGTDAFVTKVDSSGSAFVYSTFLGGGDTDNGYGIAVDTTGSAYVAGATSSTNFPLANPFQSSPGFNSDAFVSKLNASGTGLVYSTYLGGSLSDQARGISVDSSGNAYVTGSTSSTDFPITAGAFQNKSRVFKTNNGGALWSNDNFGLPVGINWLAVDPSNANRVFAATQKGVYLSQNGGRNWTASNTGLTDLSVLVLAIDPSNPSIIYAGTTEQGIFKSTNGGGSWSQSNGGLLTSTLTFVRAISIDPVNSGTVYISTQFAAAKTINGGATWNEFPSGGYSSFAINPQNPQQIYASLNSPPLGGVLKSNDGGGSWNTVGLASSSVLRVAIDPVNPNILYAGTNDGLFKSIDGGNTWNLSLNISFISAIAIDPLTPTTVYACGFSDTNAVFKTNNGGASWSQLPNGFTTSAGLLAITPSSPNNVFALGVINSDSDAFVTKLGASGNSLSYSTSLGGHKGSTGTNDSGAAIAVDASGNTYVTGVARSTDFPVTTDAFQPINRGFDDIFVAKISNAFSISGVITDGSTPQANVKVTLSGSLTGTTVTGTDGFYEFVNLTPGGTFTVSATKTGFVAAPPAQTFTNINANQTANFTISPTATPFFTISGQVVVLETLSPLSGVTVALTGSQTEFTTTDSQGNYSFSAPAGGNYTVTPTLLGFNFSPPNNTANNLQANTTLNFQSVRTDFVVVNTNDHGAGSLRQAMLDANATQGADRITFNIPGNGVRILNLIAPLPTITDPVTIDGSTQPGFVSSPLIELNGTAVGNDSPGLTINSGNSTIRSLAINRFQGAGITLQTNGNNKIEGNIIGLDPTGIFKQANVGGGIAVGSNSSGNIIGGTTAAKRNIISGNINSGISIAASDTVIKGNYIGTNAAGTVALGNSSHGIATFNFGQPLSNIQIGGTETGAGNLISGNGDRGIDAGAPGMTIQGNLIGTDVSGTAKIGNLTGVVVNHNNIVVGGTTAAAKNIISGNGVGMRVDLTFGTVVTIQGNYIGTDITGTIKLGNSTGVNLTGKATLGGTVAGAGNLISGNDTAGIQVDGALTGNSIQGNLIGTDVTGTKPLGNFTGIEMQSALNVIGGSIAGARNVISGNIIGIHNDGFGNVIKGNYIGLNIDGTAPIPNTSAGMQSENASNSTIGGIIAGEGNKIAFNGVGILLNNSSPNNSIRGNSIFSNVGLGIGLNSAVFPATNDQGDTDDGANHLQNFPLITNIQSSSNSTNFQGSLNSTPNTTFTIDLYSVRACDPSGNGEGAVSIGTLQVTTDATGNATFNGPVSVGIGANRTLTATATDPAGNTSGFSPCSASVTAGSVEFSDLQMNVLEDVGNAQIRVQRTGGSKGTLTVNYATADLTATAGSDYTAASGSLTFADGETEKIVNIPIANDGVVEPEETVQLTLSGTSELEALGGKYNATLHIFDANTPLTIMLEGQDPDDFSFPEGNVGNSNAAIRVRLSAATSRTVSVDFSTSNGTALSGSDFVSTSGTLVFNPGTETKDILIPIIGDTLDESSEFFVLQLSNPVNASLPFTLFTINIIDDDPLPQVSISDVAVLEAAGAKAVFAIQLSAASGRTVFVNVATANGTATAGSDYTATSAQLTFNPGETTKLFEVPILSDGSGEPDENFFVNLTIPAPPRVTIADGQGLGTIVDASSSTTTIVRFTSATFAANEGDNQAQITLTREGSTAGESTVNYRTISQTASERTDFTATSGSLKFAAGETSKSFVVLLTDDSFKENDETLALALSGQTGALLGGPSVAILSIISNDLLDLDSPVRPTSFNTSFFVRQHYHDFLNREPDPGGLAFWMNEIDSCATDQCREVKRINVSAAFFQSIEFQETGYLVYRAYKAAYGDTTSPNVSVPVPIIRLNEFLPDSQKISTGVQVGIGNWEIILENNKVAYFQDFVGRQRFLDVFPLSLTPAQFVDKLNQNSGGVLSPAERDQLVTELTAASNVTQGRASVLRKVAEDVDMRNNEKNRAFVLMEYYGYLRRNPDDPQDTDFRGWEFWLNKLNQFNGNFVQAEMVKAFLSSDEYIKRFGL